MSKRVFCASTTIDGGVSQNQFTSLNLGAHVGDQPTAVNKNRRLLSKALSAYSPSSKDITWLTQTHSTDVLELLAPAEAGTLDADGAYTQERELPCTVMTADCMALMISNTRGSEVAAVHAGWKGLHNGVIENAINKFTSPPNDLHIWFAPSISQQHFEVSRDLKDVFSDFPEAIKKSTDKNKFLLSLIDVANSKLDDLGIHQRYYSNICTYSANNLFSHRRATHQGLSTCGRMANLILIKNLHH